MSEVYIYGIRLIECECGVWRIPDEAVSDKVFKIPCWSHESRKQTTVEAVGQLRQAVRNFGYEFLKAVRLVK